MTDNAPIIKKIEDSCVINDFELFSLNLYDRNIIWCKNEYRKFMIEKFGDEYLKDLKNYMIKKRDAEIKVAIFEINAIYDEEWKNLLNEELEKDG